MAEDTRTVAVETDPVVLEAQKQKLIQELKDGAKWCAMRKISHEGKSKLAQWMKPDMGDPMWTGASAEALNWISKNLPKFQALVLKTRKEIADGQAKAANGTEVLDG